MKPCDRKHPLFSACGLNCGLCPRHHTQGTSKCPGCAGTGFSAKHPPCGILSCCQRHGVEFCYLCVEYPCRRYDGADLYDSFVTHMHQIRDLDKAKDIGIDTYMAELNRKVEILKGLLERYDDGRKKSFFCLAVNLLELQDVEIVMERIAGEVQPAVSQKEKAVAAACLFEAMAEERNISLMLRKRPKP